MIKALFLAFVLTLVSAVSPAQTPDVYYSLGVTLLMDSNYSAAIKCFDKVLEHNDRDIGSLTLRGYAKMKEGKYREALEDFNRAVKIDPKDPSTWNHRGLCKKELKNYRSALSDFSWALQLDPENKEALFNRGVVKYYHLNDLKGACNDWHKADSLGHSPSGKLWKKHCRTAKK